MKKTIYAVCILAVIALFSFAPQKTSEKDFKIEFTSNQAVMLYNALDFCKVAMETSQAPSVEVHNTNKILDSVQSIIRVQYIQHQQDTTNKKK